MLPDRLQTGYPQFFPADGSYHVINAVCFRTVDRCHLDRSHRFDSCLDRQTYHIVQMSFFQNITCCHIICTEADSSCKCRIYLCHCSDILCQNVLRKTRGSACAFLFSSSLQLPRGRSFHDPGALLHTGIRSDHCLLPSVHIQIPADGS